MTSVKVGVHRTSSGDTAASPRLRPPAPFIAKTFNMLQDSTNADAVAWGPGGASVVIRKVWCPPMGGALKTPTMIQCQWLFGHCTMGTTRSWSAVHCH